MTKLWCIAIALGDPAEGMVVVSMQAGGLQEMAVAQAVSDVYRQTGTKLPLMGVNVRELTREYLESVLKEMAEDEGPPDPVVQLVPSSWQEFHMSQSKTKHPDPEYLAARRREIEQIAGRAIDWATIERGDPAA